MGRSDNDTLGCLVGVPALLLLAWAAYVAFPISAISLGAGLVYAVLNGHLPKQVSPTLSGSLTARLLIEFKRMAFWFFLATAIVWIVQISVNLFRTYVSPEAFGSAELQVYKVADALRFFLSPGTAIFVLAGTLLLAAMLRGAWSMTILGRTRHAANSMLMLFGSLALFTFVSGEC